jgi:hypothetical protein
MLIIIKSKKLSKLKQRGITITTVDEIPILYIEDPRWGTPYGKDPQWWSRTERILHQGVLKQIESSLRALYREDPSFLLKIGDIVAIAFVSHYFLQLKVVKGMASPWNCESIMIVQFLTLRERPLFFHISIR